MGCLRSLLHFVSMDQKSIKFRRSVRVTAFVVWTAMALGFMEVSTRIIYAFEEDIKFFPPISRFLQQELNLNEYEIPSPKGGYHWVLKPGYRATVKELIQVKKMTGRTLGASLLEEALANKESRVRTVFRINNVGFKGPEIDPAHTRTRILMLGDSTTFGFGFFEYPDVIRKKLNMSGMPVEVINGGVEGYRSRNLFQELDLYRRLKPEIVTLYIGWNSLFTQSPWLIEWEEKIRLLWLFKKVYRFLDFTINKQSNNTHNLYAKQPYPDVNSDAVSELDQFEPPYIDGVGRLIEEFKSMGTKVVLVTLPGLFTLSYAPSPKALKMGHLPAFTDNPFVLAKLTERYNQALLRLAERQGLPIIDLAKWSNEVFKPRDRFFSDSVHLTPEGIKQVGNYLAEQLRGFLDEERPR